MYLLALSLGYCLAYLCLHALFARFFTGRFAAPGRGSGLSLLVVFLFSHLTFFVSAMVPDMELSNRVLHVFGGGFLAFLTCFLAARDAGVAIGRFQFVVFSFLCVLALGVANEIAEYYLQNYFHVGFARQVNDTWLDLQSNVVGALLGAACCTPFFSPKHGATRTKSSRRIA